MQTVVQPSRVSASLRIVNLLAVIVPFVALVVAIVVLWGTDFNWLYLILMVAMYLATGLGVTVGYHRLFAHQSFVTNTFGTWVLGVLGSMAAEGPIHDWVGWHRRHHHHSDKQGDPHSPYTHDHGNTLKGLLMGFWHSHMGWFVRLLPTDNRPYVVDLIKDPVVSTIDRHFTLWVVTGLLIPAVIGAIIERSWTGALLGFLWGGLVRVFLVHHTTWSINSVCHMWGSRSFESHDESRNNVLFGIICLGEGWHNNHHAFPTSARLGLRWWELDLGYAAIRAMSWTGLAADIRLPDPDRIAAKRRK